MKGRIGKITFLGLATACAIVLSYVEAMLPPIWTAVPGVKIGLANIVVIYLLYRFSLKQAAAVSFVRILAITMLFGNAMIMLYSIVGAALSLGVMTALKKTNAFSMVGVSVAGGVAHNLGQIITAMLIMQTKEIGYYMIVLSFSGILAGIAIGLIGAMMIKYTAKVKF